MASKQMTKLFEGVSFAEFARIIDRTKGYVSQLKSAGRLVLTADGKRVLVEESRARIKATSDPAKWPLTLAHEAERKRKAESVEQKEPTGMIPDPYDDFLCDLLTDTRTEIVAGLMVDVDLSYETASLAFDEMVACIWEMRESQGFQSSLWSVKNPRDSSTPEEWRAQIKVDIEQRAQELAVLREEKI